MASRKTRPITYGRRSSKRQTPPQEEEEFGVRSPSSSSSPSRRRRKIQTQPSSTSNEYHITSTPRGTKRKRSVPLRSAPPTAGPSKKAKEDVETDVSTDSENTNHPQHTSRDTDIRYATPPSPSKPCVTYLSRTPSAPHRMQSSVGSLNPHSPRQPGILSIEPLTNPALSPPRSTTKDLTELFDFSPSGGIRTSVKRHDRGTGLGVAKRMLSRARTEPTLGSSQGSPSTASFSPDSHGPGKNGIGVKSEEKSYKVISTTPSDSPKSWNKRANDANGDVSSIIPSTSVVTSPPLTRTYAGKSRSFLVALPATSNISNDHPGAVSDIHAQEDSELRDSYADLQKRWGIDNSDDDPHFLPLSNDQTSPELSSMSLVNDLRSITDLRSRGESRRFLDEVGYLFEGMDKSTGINVRRGSALEIVDKLCDVEFFRKAKAADFLGRAWDVCRAAGGGVGDKVLDSILALFAALVTRESRSLAEFTNRTDFVVTLFEMLSSIDRDKDSLLLIGAKVGDLQLKNAGLGKAETIILRRLFDLIINKSSLFPRDVRLSTRLLVSQTLVSLSPHLLDLACLSSLYHSLSSELYILFPRISSYMAGLSILPSNEQSSYIDFPSLHHIANCLLLMDSFLLGKWADMKYSPSAGALLEQEHLARGLVMLWVVADVISRDSACQTSWDIAQQCIESALRVMINLSHGSNRWCCYLLDNELTVPSILRLIMTLHWQSSGSPDMDTGQNTSLHSVSDNEGQSLDRLCLALALLTNLVQGAEKAKDLVREIMIDPLCPGKRLCTYACCCPSRINGLECLVSVYLRHREHLREADLGMQFLCGHLAILFGLLMQQNAANKAALLAILPGNSDDIKLDSLIVHGHDLIALHSEFAMRVSETSTSAGDEGREEHEAADGNISTVQDAGLVLSFLEQLRDAMLVHTKS